MAMNNPYTGTSINSIVTDDWDKIRTTASDTAMWGTTLTDHAIKGKMVTVQHTANPAINFSEKEIKEYLIEKLANGLMDQNVVEFTKLQKPDGSIDYRARIFVTPNDQTQILRTSGIK